MLFYILSEDDKYTFLSGQEEHKVYVDTTQNYTLILNRSDDVEVQQYGYGDYQLATQTSIDQVLHALGNVYSEDCLVVIANDEMDFDWYPLTFARGRDPYQNTEVLVDTQERLELRQLLTNALNDPFFRYGI